MTKIIKRETIAEKSNHKPPEFYKSLTGNPVTDIIVGNRRASKNTIVLKRTMDIPISVPEGVLITEPFPVVVPGNMSYTFSHGIHKIPFVTIYKNSVPNACTVAIYVRKDTFEVEIKNFSTTTPQDTTIRVVIYEIRYRKNK